MTAGAFSMNCGMTGPSPGIGFPETFDENWLGSNIALRERGRVRCTRLEYCSYGEDCSRRCTTYSINSQNPSQILRNVTSDCLFIQELSDSGDTLILTCETCGVDGIFRVDSAEELDTSETLIVDRDDAEKSFERLDPSVYGSCEDFLRSLTEPVVEP